MNSRSRNCILSFVIFLCAGGCSGGGPETVPVSGTVSLAGRELPKVCRLFFQPVNSPGLSRPSVTDVEPDGSYAVKAFQDSDGLLPGTYQVRVSYFDLKPGADPNSEASWIEQSHDAGELVVDADSGGVEHNIEIPTQARR